MASTVRINFNEPLFPLATIFSAIEFTITNGSGSVVITERSNVEGRSQFEEFTVFSTFSAAQCASSYVSAFTLDYINTNFPGIADISLISGTIVEVTLEDGYTVTDTRDDFDDAITFVTNNDNTPPVDPLTIAVVVSTRAEAPCDTVNMDITITGGTPPFVVVQNGISRPSTSDRNPTYPSGRGLTVLNTVTDANGLTASTTTRLPERLVESNFAINIIQGISGATVNVVPLVTVSGLEFSLNGTDFSTSSSFGNQAAGDYTMFIRDSFGCTIQIPYTISEISPVPLDPFFLYPEANMVRMYQVQNDSESIRANYYNRESCNESVRGFSYQNIQYWEAEDIHAIQFKTNHENVQLFTVDPDGNEVELGITKIVENIGLNDGRDGKYFRASSNTIGLYFDTGNTYDFDTREANGTYAISSGLLPSFIVQGVFVDVQGLGIKEVIATAYDSTRQRWYAVLDGIIAVGPDVETQVYTTYNNQNYDVYGTSIPMASRLNTNFKYIIRTALAEYKSEEQRVVSSLKGVVIDYSNSENKYDVVYAADPSPRYRLRLPLMDINKLVPDNTVENYNSDDSPIQLDTKLYKNFELRCEDLSTAMAYKTLLALLHDVVTVNGLEMTFKEITEFEPYENTNLYSVRILMIEGGNAAARQREETINLAIATAIRLEAELGLINYSA